MASNQIYFKGLNGLRFIAASLVVFHHVSQYKYWAGKPGVWGEDSLLFNFVDAIGNKAVSLFFVLSGFLISYLLMQELERTNTVALKKFYVRRILRIWPLYFVIIAIALFLLPQFVNIGNWNELLKENFTVTLILHLLILPNLMRATSVQVVGASQAWSIGVEEQFYLIWPILMKWFKKSIPQFLVVFIVAKLLIGWFGLIAIDYVEGSLQVALDKFNTVWQLMMIEQMAVGALGAWFLYSNNEKILKAIYSKTSQIITIILLVIILLTEGHWYLSKFLEAFVFTSLIMNVSLNDRFPIKLTSTKFDMLGNMSYGIYMWHTMMIAVVLTGLEYFNFEYGILYNLVAFILPYLLTLVISYLSFVYFEKPFLKFKENFMVVKSSSTGKS